MTITEDILTAHLSRGDFFRAGSRNFLLERGVPTCWGGVCLPAFEEATRLVLVSVFLIPTF